MAKYATGKYARAISDRSGMEFPYKEMVKEWNGSRVHVSEFEAKHPHTFREMYQFWVCKIFHLNTQKHYYFFLCFP